MVQLYHSRTDTNSVIMARHVALLGTRQTKARIGRHLTIPSQVGLYGGFREEEKKHYLIGYVYDAECHCSLLSSDAWPDPAVRVKAR